MKNVYKMAMNIMVMLAIVVSSLPIVNTQANETLSYGDWEYVIIDGNITITKYNGNEKNVTVPNQIETKNVTKINMRAFIDCKSLDSIRIPQNVTDIECSVSGKENLSSIEVDSENQNYSSEDGVLYNKKKTVLLSYPGAKNDESFTISNNVKTIAEAAFAGVKKIQKVVVPNRVKTIGKNAFEGCIKLRDVHMSSGLESIEYYAFDGCESLKSISLPETVKQIGSRAFGYCKGLKEINIPSKVTDIKSETFTGCENLTKVNLPKNLTKISSMSFSYCYSLEEIVIPQFVKTIEKKAFLYCKKLKSVKFMGKPPVGLYADIFDECDLDLVVFYPKQYKKYWSEYTDYKTVAHSDLKIKVSKIKLNRKKASLRVGKKLRLKYEITPYEADLKTVRWKSSNKKVAVVTKKGLVKAKKAGRCTITVITKDGSKKATCKIIVKRKVKRNKKK